MRKFKLNPAKRSAPVALTQRSIHHTIVISVQTVRFSTSRGDDGITRVDFVAILAFYNFDS